MIEVRTRFKNYEEIEEITAWMTSQVGRGSQRHRKNTWMGTNDWFFYHDYHEAEEGEPTDDVFDADPDMIFVFRREEDAAMFSLKWL